MNWPKDYSGLTIWLTNLPTLADLTVRLTTRLTIQSWQFRLQFSLTIPLYNSYLQFRLTNSYLQIRRSYNLADQSEWNDPSVRAATLPWSQAGVSCRGLRWRTLAESDARMGRVTHGKDGFWWYFSVGRFPIMDLSPGPTPATLNRNCWCRWFYTYSRRFTHVCLRVRVYLRAMHFYGRDYFTNCLRLKVLNF